MAGLLIVAILLMVGFTWGGYALGKPRGYAVLGLAGGAFAGLIMILVHFILGILLGGLVLLLCGVLPPTPTSEQGRRNAESGGSPGWSPAAGPRSSPQGDMMAKLEDLKRQGVLTDEEYKKAVKKNLGIE